MSRWSVRSKVLAWVLVTTAIGMAVAGVTSYAIQNERLDGSVDADLGQEVREFEALAADGVDPQTGEPFSSVDQLLAVALRRNVPNAFETHLTLLEGRVHGYSGGDRPLALEDDADAMAAITSIPPDSPVRYTDVDTEIGQVRLVVVQVGVAGAPTTGTYVVAHAIGQQRDQLVELMQVYATVAVGSLVVVGLVGWVVAGRLLGPLHALRDAAGRIHEDDLTERIPERGDDDVSQLTRSYNAMLDRLQTSFETQRQFLDDAGHELRTPVTILSGHLQVMDPDDPEAVRETRTLLMDETDRMGRLVEDLILLAKARRPDFVRSGTVDLAVLTDDVLDKARGLGERNWCLDALADVQVPGDTQRLTQAVLQLCHNAVKFSEPGSTVGIGSRLVPADPSGSRPGRAEIWVRDEGVGIAQEDVHRVLDRFARVETGRGVEGSGLGLAIVSAIAEGHGGHVQVDSVPGEGSVLTIVLPAPAGVTDDHDVREDLP